MRVFSSPHAPQSSEKSLQNFEQYNIAITKNRITSSFASSKVTHILGIIWDFNFKKLRILKQHAA